MIFFGFLCALLLIAHTYVKAVEKSAMVHDMPVSKITEGEWIVHEVKHNGKLICGPKDLGISNEQIAELKEAKIKKVTIKVGIPFIPAFLAGFLLTVFWGNVLFVLLRVWI